MDTLVTISRPTTTAEIAQAKAAAAAENPYAHVVDEAPWYAMQSPLWSMADHLEGGTATMREAGETYLPKFPGEQDTIYHRRLQQATLTNFYKQIGRRMLGFVFGGEPIKISKSKIPEELLNNIDRRGNDVHGFARSLGRSFMRRGLHHIMVAHPPRPEGVITARDAQQAGLRPYWANIAAPTVFNAFATSDTGEERLLQVRYWDNAQSMSGFEIVTRERIRVLQLTDAGVVLQTFEKVRNASDTEDVWKKTDESPVFTDAAGKPLRILPWVTLYTNRDAFMTSRSLLEDIAYKQVEHWQSASDQRNILTVTRYPTQYQIGTENPVQINGPHYGLHAQGNSKDHQPVEFGWIGAPSEPVAAGERDLERIVSEAEALGVQLMTKQKVKTALQAGIEFTQDTSPLQDFAQSIEDGLNGALRVTAIWLGIDPAQAGYATVDKEFGGGANDAMRADSIIKARLNGDISRETFWRELKSLGVLSEDFDPEAEKLALQKEEEDSVPRPAPPPPNFGPGAIDGAQPGGAGNGEGQGANDA